MTLIKNATTTLTSGTATGAELISLGTTGGSTSIQMTLAELKTWIGEIRDKILEDTTSIEVIGSGTNEAVVTLNGTEIFRWITTALQPKTTNTLDIGTTTNLIKNIFIEGGINVNPGSDATGDLFFRDAAGKFQRLGVGALNEVITSDGTLPYWGAGGGGSGDSRWQTWSSAAFTTADTITCTNNIVAGTPVRFKDNGSYDWRYAIVSDLTGNVHTILGHTVLVGDDTFEYGQPELVVNETIVVPGSFGDATSTAAATGGLLYDDLLMQFHMIWNRASGYLVNIGASCISADSSGDPTLVGTISTDNSTFTTTFAAIDVDTTLHSTTHASLVAKYEILYGNYIEFTVAAGNTGDAKDMSIQLTFILE